MYTIFYAFICFEYANQYRIRIMNESYKMIRENQMSKKNIFKAYCSSIQIIMLAQHKMQKKSHKNKKSLSLFQVRHGTMIHVIP